MTRRRTARILGLGEAPAERRWAAVSLVDSVGSGLVAPVTVLYFTRFVRLSASSVGAGLTLAGLIALCLTPLAGAATDRFGPRRTLVGYWTLSALAYAAHALVHGWTGFVVVTAMALTSGYSTKSVKQAFLADFAEGEQRVRLMAFQRAVRNAGFALGGLLATLALACGNGGYLVVVYGNAVSYAAAAVAVTTIPLGHRHPPAVAPGSRARHDYPRVLRDGPYTALAALDFLVGFQATALEVAVPLWVAASTRAPAALVGVLFTVNTLMVVFLQVRVARGIRDLADAPRLHIRSVALFALAATAYLAAGQATAGLAVSCLLVAVVLHSATELYASTAQWTVATDLADPAHRGKYLAVFSSGGSLQQAVGPVVVTSLLAAGGSWAWPAVALLYAVGAVLSAYLVRRVTGKSAEGAVRGPLSGIA